MDETALNELADSIREQGLMQPILVRPVDGGRFEIIAGERRWRAAQRAGLTEVPALVKNVPDHSALALSLIENIQREDLNPLEEATGLQRLIDEFGLTHEAAAKAVGRSRSAVTNLLRLLQLAKPAQEHLLARRHRDGPCARDAGAAGGAAGQRRRARRRRQPVGARNGAAGVHAAQSGQARGAPQRAARVTTPTRRASKPNSRKSWARKCRSSRQEGRRQARHPLLELEQLDGILARLR